MMDIRKPGYCCNARSVVEVVRTVAALKVFHGGGQAEAYTDPNPSRIPADNLVREFNCNFHIIKAGTIASVMSPAQTTAPWA